MSIKTVHDVSCRFQLSFFAMCRLHTFPWKSLETELQNSPSEVILDILKKTCLHPVCRKNPPSVKYRRLFLSELIKRHESTTSEPLDELYDALAEVMGAGEETVCYKTYFLPSGKPVSLEENVAMISEGTTGLVTWEAALYLAEWALENTHIFTGRTVLELGSGAGLTGVAVCHACKPKKYIFTDCHQSVLQRLQNNIQHNGLNEEDGTGVSACVEELDWEHAREEELRRIGAETIIAADVVYDPEIVGCLVRLLVKLLKIQKKPPEVYISSTIRNPGTYTSFKKELEKAGLKHVIVTNPVTQVFPYDRVSSIEIINVQRC
ncbi:protein-lysine N-methyltransferase EEF2KMT isoform X1 [Pangasianodon hypophthalmus]|uniref:protein-lysine N-methyltransferase EEF2KMT isoform X1 n=1 Tax=Pangasianodon hypophthalmus TaxID=310915 RepID=UPI000EFFFC02|nr:protein-lysine N-methyltransferase EEF2KMT isoform X1 [Pangasianodon hypophthalmus]